jgi:hypothetical protein
VYRADNRLEDVDAILRVSPVNSNRPWNPEVIRRTVLEVGARAECASGTTEDGNSRAGVSFETRPGIIKRITQLVFSASSLSGRFISMKAISSFTS